LTDPIVLYVLDTNAISALMRTEARMASWLASIGADDRVVICTVTRGEILFGLERLAQGRRRTELEGKARKLFALVSLDSDFQGIEGLAVVEP
jgi:predicted nucleic acid-binding protein